VKDSACGADGTIGSCLAHEGLSKPVAVMTITIVRPAPLASISACTLVLAVSPEVRDGRYLDRRDQLPIT
jgi:hypothetical protein